MKKTEVINIRMTPKDKVILEQKAAKAGKTLSGYVLSVALGHEDKEVLSGIEALKAKTEGASVGGGTYLLYKASIWLYYPGSRSGRYQYLKLSAFPEPIIQYFRKRPISAKSWLPWPDMAEIAQYIYETFPGLTPRGLWLFSDQVALAVSDGESLESAVEETLAIAEKGWYETKETKAAMA